MPSSRPRERFAPDEAREVIRRIGSDRLGRVEKVVEFDRGSSRSPKLLISRETSRWLLKRRAPINAAPERVRFCQDFQRRLELALVPVAAPQPFKSGETSLRMGDHVYEYFRFVDGARYQRSVDHAQAAGEALGQLLLAAMTMRLDGDPVHGSFHASGIILGAAKLAEESVPAVEPEVDRAELLGHTKALRQMYRVAAQRGIESGFAATGVQPIHGDYHPGNLIFSGGEVAAIVDFDAARVEPRAVEVANALLHLGSLRLPSHEIDEWPAGLDPLLVRAAMGGVKRAGVTLELPERRAIPWLMIEACIAEGIVPIARTGSLANLQGSAMVRFLRRRAEWIREEEPLILEALSPSS